MKFSIAFPNNRWPNEGTSVLAADVGGVTF